MKHSNPSCSWPLGLMAALASAFAAPAWAQSGQALHEPVQMRLAGRSALSGTPPAEGVVQPEVVGGRIAKPGRITSRPTHRTRAIARRTRRLIRYSVS